MKLQDLTGRGFGALLVIRRVGTTAAKQPLWEALCDCGKTIERTGQELRKSGENASCGCRKGVARRKDITGRTFGRLTVLRSAGYPLWECRCTCGSTHVTTTNNLTSGSVKSCGCLKTDVLKTRRSPLAGIPSKHRKDWTGQKFHHLTFLRPAEFSGPGRLKWEAQCDCGRMTSVVPKSVVGGNTTSCGCARKQAAKKRAERESGAPREALRQKSRSAIGQTFGLLTVRDVRWVDTDSYRVAFADCTCACGNSYSVRLPDLRSKSTVSCGCGNPVSADETDIVDWLSALTEVDAQHRIGSWVYDIAVPSSRLLIEYNGVWWHSSRFVSRGRHLIKRRHAEDAGWRVVNLWSDDWHSNRPRFEQLILDAAGLADRRTIGARQFEIEPISRDAALTHHAGYHVQKGPPVGGTHLGAFFGGDLLAAFTFARHKTLVELTRYSLVSGVSAPGLLAKVIKRLDSRVPIVTFADRDYFTGGVYTRAGFTKNGTTLQLTYVDGSNTRRRRETLMKHKLPAQDIHVGDLSEKDALSAVGIHQCWNSGVDKWVKHP